MDNNYMVAVQKLDILFEFEEGKNFLYLTISNLQIPIEKDGVDEYLTAAAQKLEVTPEEISLKKILSKNLDLKNQKQFYYKVAIAVSIDDNYDNKAGFAPYAEPEKIIRKTTAIKDRPIIVGFGPAGMFATLELIAYGIKPIIFERGKKIEERSIDVQDFITKRKLNPESNIQFV